MVDVAQLVRAPVCGTGGRGFKSRHPPQLFSPTVFPPEIFMLKIRLVGPLQKGLALPRAALAMAGWAIF